uniref:Uncharacterized protein n=1 Tax=Thermocrispum agreste TaxID=37925 RepID=A0A2W4J7I5_9PSEU|nr:MAG: hypothetical protein DIU77_12820 [Thermocrispum agreste]
MVAGAAVVARGVTRETGVLAAGIGLGGVDGVTVARTPLREARSARSSIAAGAVASGAAPER